MLVEEFRGDVEEARGKTAAEEASAGANAFESLSAASKVACVLAGKGSIWEMRNNVNYGSACNQEPQIKGEWKFYRKLIVIRSGYQQSGGLRSPQLSMGTIPETTDKIIVSFFFLKK
jgi:hypothetical protein